MVCTIPGVALRARTARCSCNLVFGLIDPVAIEALVIGKFLPRSRIVVIIDRQDAAEALDSVSDPAAAPSQQNAVDRADTLAIRTVDFVLSTLPRAINERVSLT